MDEDSDSFECPKPQCSEEFHSRSELETHLNVIAHHSPVGTVQRSLYDQLRIDWVQRFQSISLDTKRQSRPDSEVEIATSTEDNFLQMGWALHKSRSGQTRFSDNVREYLQKKFDIGRETGRKEDPAQVASDMRKARNTDGTRMFSRAEWLSKVQIQAFFSRISAKRKQSSSKESSRDNADDELDDSDAEEYTCEIDDLLFQANSEAVVAAIAVKHPLMYDVHNLCEMAYENKISSFKVKMFREICKHFEISFNTRDTRSALVHKLWEMVRDCSCMSE